MDRDGMHGNRTDDGRHGMHGTGRDSWHWVECIKTGRNFMGHGMGLERDEKNAWHGAECIERDCIHKLTGRNVRYGMAWYGMIHTGHDHDAGNGHNYDADIDQTLAMAQVSL